MEIGASETAQSALLVIVDGELGSVGVAAATGFDLDEAEGGTMPGDEVEVPAELCGSPAAGDDDVAGAAEIEESLALAEASGLKVRG